MNEAETRAELIDPALREAGWGQVEGSRIAREVIISPGKLLGAGRRARKEIADYVLIYRNRSLAVVEAKKQDEEVTEGLGQAKRYAGNMQARFAFATNGRGIYRVDMETGEEGAVGAYPSPQEMWEQIFGSRHDAESFWREQFSRVLFESRGGQWELRYYQHNAITNVLDAVARGQDRILLTLATGTGKTAIAFQIAWKLFHSRWNLRDWRAGVSDSPSGRLPRILFLADRNNLADQAFNAFSAFPEDALARISPDSIRKKGRVPKNASIFFTIFQTFMSGTDENGVPKPYFGDYPPDFFDFIVIDECHRGGANDESTWRGIMEYFSPAVQLGLTATPKRKQNADTYAYFGEPVYVYSLKEGINEGFLTPFKVVQVGTTLDEYVYTGDDEVLEGEVEEGRLYEERDFNNSIVIEAREKKRVEIFMERIDQNQKTLVFCMNQKHALLVRDLINQMKTSTHPDYCVRVTADEGKIGDEHLEMFRDNEKTIPTILTTSHKLSTGVDARNVRNIVLMRPVNSIIEFKQIIGRGTRLFEGKDYFTIYDFVKAYRMFNDPEWDGEPLDPVVKEEGGTYGPDQPPELPGTIADPPPTPRPQKIRIKLAAGKERTIQYMTSTSFWGADGQPISAEEFVRRLFGELPGLFRDEDELRRLWGNPGTRRKLLEQLEEHGFGKEQLGELARIIDAEKSDLYDVLTWVAYNSPPISREERVRTHRDSVMTHYSGKQQEFVEFVLKQYVRQGVAELDADKLVQLVELKYHAVADAVEQLGSVETIRETFIGFQPYLYGEQPPSRPS